jgi:hypothetical protein
MSNNSMPQMFGLGLFDGTEDGLMRGRFRKQHGVVEPGKVTR